MEEETKGWIAGIMIIFFSILVLFVIFLTVVEMKQGWDLADEREEFCESLGGDLDTDYNYCNFIEDNKLIQKKVIKFRGTWRMIDN